MSLTDAEKEAYARVSTTIVSLWAVEFRHSTFSTNEVRIVNYRNNIDHTLESTAPADPNTTVTFVGLGFEFTAPKISEDPVSTVSIEFDGVSGTLQPYLAAANQTIEPIECTLRELLYDTESQTVLQQPSTFHMKVLSSTSTMMSVNVEIARMNSANQTFPNEFYTAKSNPGLL